MRNLPAGLKTAATCFPVGSLIGARNRQNPFPRGQLGLKHATHAYRDESCASRLYQNRRISAQFLSTRSIIRVTSCAG